MAFLFAKHIRSQAKTRDGAANMISNGSRGNLYRTEPMMTMYTKVRYTNNPSMGVRYQNISRLVIKVTNANKINGNTAKVEATANGFPETEDV